ncbi:hypothetical protein C5167_023150 [Papaver somniferum]|uniref:Uncharacterized protein n=1 Tax=Papaver somniferum TaxID=3469 RepID=A0A4Y7JNW0_PAPSO|nr:hypothetical protein C5167_023150 [Papaver somniferum]
MEIAVSVLLNFTVRINLQFLRIIRSPGVHTGKESQCKSLSPTAAALSLLNQSNVKLELCSLVWSSKVYGKGSCCSGDREVNVRVVVMDFNHFIHGQHGRTSPVPCLSFLLVPDYSYAVRVIFIKRPRG